MKSPPRIGLSGEQQFTVEAKHLIDFAEGGMPAVLCTPALIGFLERTARQALAPLLEPGESSVGTEIDVNHLAPTPAGQTVTCVVRVVQVEGRRVDFQLEARDEQELIARGLHRRQIIRVDRFAQTVRGKTENR
jgi:fluoroacetyl-CoA thioesterase